MQVLLILLTKRSGSAKYFSSAPYQSFPSDSIGSQAFSDCLLSLPEFEASDSSLSFGGFEFIERTPVQFLRERWEGAEVRILKLTSEHSSFDSAELVFFGYAESISCPSMSRISVLIGSVELKLRKNVAEVKIADQTIPTCFGKVLSMKPVLIDKVNLVYKLNTNPIWSAIIYDNGLPVQAAIDTQEATATLLNSSFGEITAQVQTLETPSLANVINSVLTLSGISSRVSYASQTPLVGTVISSGQSLGTALSSLWKNSGYNFSINSVGAASLRKIADGTALELTSANCKLNSLSVVSVTPEKSKVTLSYAQNFSPITSPASSIEDESRISFLKTSSSEVSLKNSSFEASILTETDELSLSCCLVEKSDALELLEEIASDAFSTILSVKLLYYITSALPFVGQLVILDIPEHGLSARGKISRISSEQKQSFIGLTVEIPLWFLSAEG